MFQEASHFSRPGIETVLGGVYVNGKLVLVDRLMQLIAPRPFDMEETGPARLLPEAPKASDLDLAVEETTLPSLDDKYSQMTPAVVVRGLGVSPDSASHLLAPPSVLLARVLGDVLRL